MKPYRHYLNHLTETRDIVVARWHAERRPSREFVQVWRHLNALEQKTPAGDAPSAHHIDVINGFGFLADPEPAACPMILVRVAERIFDWQHPVENIAVWNSKTLCHLARKLLQDPMSEKVAVQVWSEFRFAEYNYPSFAVLVALERVGQTLLPFGRSRARQESTDQQYAASQALHQALKRAALAIKRRPMDLERRAAGNRIRLRWKNDPRPPKPPVHPSQWWELYQSAQAEKKRGKNSDDR